MRIIAVANQKGGCGKTTTSINLAACLAYLQRKTLLLDLDPQGHSTCGLGIKSSDAPVSLYDLLTPLRQTYPPLSSIAVTVNPFLQVIPTYGILGALEEELVLMPDREKRLKNFLSNPELGKMGIEYVVLDCPPNLGLLSYNALQAADEIIIPIEPSFFSLHGLAKMSETIEIMNKERMKPLEVHALLTLFNSEMRFSEEVYEEVKSHFKGKLFASIIHDSVLLKEAVAAGQSIVDYEPASSAFRDYISLATEYLERQWDRVLPPQKLGWDNVMREHYGPRRVPGGVLFVVSSQSARWVEIAGDFNNWVPEPMIKGEEGLWQKVIPVVPGQYRYKFIIDGEWQMDPHQPSQKRNIYGTFDSILEIS